ncbi:uncharacterized protein LOC121917700 [Sceloporus undulatus]|uniref:uncharacterized protein LOC121917700 n=1 Tax=Sceloporus undulatus TaxID=8520 RepID=UPI001C4CD2AE|nr:uncharacterized protein LOC121917700 [Sceloporus undulatus]
MSLNASQSKRKHGRGILWEHAEILDLLCFWGDEEIQRRLNSNHRNLAVYKIISDQMQSRGHDRTPEECRIKCKAMKQNYTNVCRHNRAICPYFYEMDKFMNGSRTVPPTKLSRNFNLPPQGTMESCVGNQEAITLPPVPAEEAEPQEVPDNRILIGEEEVYNNLYAVPTEKLQAQDMLGGQEQEDMPGSQELEDIPGGQEQEDMQGSQEQEDPHSSGEDTIVEGQDDAPPSETPNAVAAVIPQPPRGHGERQNRRERPGVVPPPVQQKKDGKARRGERIANSIIAHGRQEWRLFRRQNRAIANRQHRQWQHESEILHQLMETYTADTQACKKESAELQACFRNMATYAADMVEAQRADTALRERDITVKESLAALQMEYLRARINHLNAANVEGQAGRSGVRQTSKRPKAQ